MKSRILVAALLLSACAGDAAPPPAPAGVRTPPEELIGKTIAKVNGQAVGSREFDLEASKRIGRDGKVPDALKQEILQKLLDDKLLYQAAIAQNVDMDPKVQQMVINTLLKNVVYADVRERSIPEEEVLAYYQDHADEFVLPAKVTIRRMLIKPGKDEDPAAAKARAEELRAQILADPTQFGSLAQKHSDGPFARRGGDFGMVTRDGRPGLPPEAVEVAFGLERGAVSELFETADGWNFVHVPRVREEVQRTFDEVRGNVLRQVKSEKYKAAYEAYLVDLKKSSDTWVDQSWLDEHDVSSIRPVDMDSATRKAMGGKQGRGGDKLRRAREERLDPDEELDEALDGGGE